MKQSLTGHGMSAAFFVLLLAGEAPAFQIADQAVAANAATDGTRYLAAVESYPASGAPTIGVQLLDADGGKVGGLFSTNRTGIAGDVSFNGENYLLTWEDDGLGTFDGTTGWQMYGQFVTRDGVLIDTPFPISSSGIWGDGMKMNVYGGGAHLIAYTKLINPANGSQATNRYIAGRMVAPDGTMGSEFRISSGYGAKPSIGFDGANFLVAWCEDQYDQSVLARFVSPAGVPGGEFPVNVSPDPSANPLSVAFDGTNYIVTWSDETGAPDSHAWDAYAQRVSRTGSLVGGVIPIANSPYPEMATTIAFDGVNCLACWVQFSTETECDIMGRFLDTSGTPVGDAFAIDTRAGTEIGGAYYGNGKYLALIVDAELGGDYGFQNVTGTDGAWVSPVGERPIDAWRGLSFGANAGNPAIAGDFADPDHDSVRNIEEYAFTGNPNAGQVGSLFTFSQVAGRPQFQFSRPYPADVAYVVQVSQDLSAWEDFAMLPENSFTWTGPAGIVETGSGNTRAVTIYDPSGGPYAPTQFARVKVMDRP